ncbi:methyl-accepting chemotaxis sensory transducer with TarH sensor [Pseudomonas sp. NFACC48-1]|nr:MULTISPECIES: methyl-accepting chemotaxis protein [unclassified Pseudomonas]SCZ20831.1 methyl-accepting chemotaxis sensory transducer with TarH sensor [Pseudomonas sp. NFACC44-2]SDA43659.1 methyl-accepting chemotaxis sensory transducer with TarH sensor [Pseudomonas sp. NFACC51]SDY54412.1 methyl-accepting chemotaxis sensory transducer with TarH sensor [Pseudomonas sp. NFACC08-1]SFH10449.1 methyl-accepting chemotaxis sensory transducer with TarH sensor [Pseudomonas sp. NFACC54]SFS44107.1 meth
MRNLSVRAKLYFLMFCFITSLAVVGTASRLGIHNAGHSMEEVSGALSAVDALASLRHARLISIAAMQEGASWRPEAFDSMSDKSDALAEAHDLFNDILTRHRQALTQAELAFKAYDTQTKSSEEQALWQEFSALWNEFQSADQVQTEICETLAQAKSWDDVHIRSLELVTNTLPWAAAIHASSEPLEKLLKLGVTDAAQAQAGGESVIATANSLIASVLGATMLILGILAALIVRSVVNPLHQLRSTFEQVRSSNDFSLRALNHGGDEVAQAASAFNALLERVQTALLEVMVGANRIDQTAQQTSTMAKQVAKSSVQQNEAATDIASAIEQMSASIGQINASTRDAHARAQDAADAAGCGAQAISRTAEETDQVTRQVGRASETISALGNETDRITTIVEVIKAVAEQTNLLALNAAIEAARAGEQGRGFAVVADEVRQLAERTRTSAEEIRDMVSSMQASARQAVAEMAIVTSRTRESQALSENAAASMNEILQSASLVSEGISAVSQALIEQDRTTQIIAQRIEAVAQMSQENCSTGEHAAAVSRSLDGAAADLRQAINQFKV